VSGVVTESGQTPNNAPRLAGGPGAGPGSVSARTSGVTAFGTCRLSFCSSEVEASGCWIANRS
jgi:hypothetical protein